MATETDKQIHTETDRKRRQTNKHGHCGDNIMNTKH